MVSTTSPFPRLAASLWACGFRMGVSAVSRPSRLEPHRHLPCLRQYLMNLHVCCTPGYRLLVCRGLSLLFMLMMFSWQPRILIL